MTEVPAVPLTVSTLVVAASLVATTTPTPSPATASRWDPAWLELLVGVAAVLVGLAVVWWLFLVVRVQDYWRDEEAPRRSR